MTKKIRCPRCDNAIFLDLSRYNDQHALHVHCVECGRDYSIRLKQDAGTEEEENERLKVGSITVLENDNCYRQEISLYEGKNSIGRRTRGNPIEVAIDSGDDDMARNHCVIEISKKRDGRWSFLLSDFGSRKGTYYRGERLGKYDKIALDDGDSVVIGSTIFMVNIPQE